MTLQKCPGGITTQVVMNTQGPPHEVRGWCLVDTSNLRTVKIFPMPWLMKAEPDSRVVKGKDVKVDLAPCRSGGCTDNSSR